LLVASVGVKRGRVFKRHVSDAIVFVLPEAVEAISQLNTHVQPTSVGGSVGALAAAGAAGMHTCAMAVQLIK
jgi:hypothetical protein